MKHSDQSTDNDVGGDVQGTSIQAGSIGEVHVTAAREPGRLRRYWYLCVAAAVVSAAVPAFVLLPDERAQQTPVAAITTTATETVTASPPASGAPVTTTSAAAARPAPARPTPRSTSTTPTTAAPTTTTTTAASVVAPPATTDVRFRGTLQFGSFHLDLAQPRDVPGTNLWRLTQNRLHGDDGYELAEWLGDGAPGQAECAADLAKRATRDAENLIAGSRVCGRSPGGRTFRVDVVTIDSTAITGDVTVWE